MCFFDYLYVSFGEVSIYIFHLFYHWVVHAFDIELHQLFVYFEDKSLVSCFICKYVLPFLGLSFCFVYGFICSVIVFKIN